MANGYNFKDFKSDQNVRWCPGCGDHAILKMLQSTLAEIGRPQEEVVVVSGIGCSSRLPYYMNTYGFHTIHGRAPAIASGVKTARPDLMVWQISGDGDALAIGGNHFIHAIRRNIDINIILFNNQIYGLTKGQYSPTSRKGTISKSSPFGTVEVPFRPGELALGARGQFFARTIDTDLELSKEVFNAAADHKGTSVIEVLQNCVIYNDKTHIAITDKEHKEDRTIHLEHGKKMIFGKNRDKGLVRVGFDVKVVTLGEGGFSEKDVLVHNAHEKDTSLHIDLVNMEYPEFPVAMGVIRSVQEPTYDENVQMQMDLVNETSSIKSFKDLVHSGNTWLVE